MPSADIRNGGAKRGSALLPMFLQKNTAPHGMSITLLWWHAHMTSMRPSPSQSTAIGNECMPGESIGCQRDPL